MAAHDEAPESAKELTMTETNDIDNSFDAVILADGDFPSAPEPLSILHEARRLVCCDGAFTTLLGHQPEEAERARTEGRLFVVGDGDSLPAGIKREYADIITQVDEQDYNDLTKATRLALTLPGASPRRIAYLGATGKREDHTLGNIALMGYYRREMGIRPEMFTDYGWFVACAGNATLTTFARQQMSIFNLGCKRFESKGLRWQSYPYREWWQGTLNECTGRSVEFSADGPYLVFRTYKAKGE